MILKEKRKLKYGRWTLWQFLFCTDENKEDVYHGDDEAEVSDPDELVFGGDSIAAAAPDQVAAMGFADPHLPPPRP